MLPRERPNPRLHPINSWPQTDQTPLGPFSGPRIESTAGRPYPCGSGVGGTSSNNGHPCQNCPKPCRQQPAVWGDLEAGAAPRRHRTTDRGEPPAPGLFSPVSLWPERCARFQRGRSAAIIPFLKPSSETSTSELFQPAAALISPKSKITAYSILYLTSRYLYR